MKSSKPAYKKIYEDMLRIKFPDKKKDCETILTKACLSEFDVLQIENILFKKRKSHMDLKDKRLRSYTQDTILQILTYQKIHELNNTQLAAHYGLSRNTVTSWKKRFLLIKVYNKNDIHINNSSL
ncbi:helix-turn-helix domain-containing protein [Chryseobacterium sp. Tr-659]|uniref:helix-turn-helix domain-containing protein n=1 Tax=Chryseobacterium sp. Tr-659 TaxID=2608340 RepID=UPI0014208A03|nr:helix-turn-helix domain-containing protein [Chryseobacterium sp. Tr-659]NIF06155.1 helix-turn-helix domain-containing protein [Chryseobacterium sp. Tr-659]